MLWGPCGFWGCVLNMKWFYRYSPAPSPHADARSFLKKPQKFALRYPSPWGWARRERSLTTDELRAKLCPGCNPCPPTPMCPLEHRPRRRTGLEGVWVGPRALGCGVRSSPGKGEERAV